MADTPLTGQIVDLLQSARDQKHRQRFYGAIAAFLQVERLIIEQLPADLQLDANAAVGPPSVKVMQTGRALLAAGARLAVAERIVEWGGLDPFKPSNSFLSATAELPVDRITAIQRERLIDDALRERATVSSDGLYLFRSEEQRDSFAASENGFSTFLRDAPARALAARLEPSDIPANLAPLYFADIPLGIGDCLVQLGQEYDRALDYYARAEAYPFTNPPFGSRDLWLRLAEAHLARGDAAYRAGDRDGARLDYQQILKDGEVPMASRLYRGSLGVMVGRVRAWLAALADDPASRSPADFPPRHVAALALAKQRSAQLTANLDFLGEPADSQPVFSFSYLREIARGLAQFAAQANREYIAFTQRAEDQTQTTRQLEQALALADAGIQVEMARRREVAAEIEAAIAAERLAIERARLASENAKHYRTVGWDIVRLDEASAWAGAAAQGDNEEIRQSYVGIEELGISGGYRNRSDLIQLISFQRARRGYGLEIGRLDRAVRELDEARRTAAAQSAAARSRVGTADAAVQAARWRGHFARVNLADAQSRETSAELYFDLGNLVRETAQIYLQRAIGTAAAMERAYNFENNSSIRRIRLDYGDLAGAGSLYAADFLLRDIDAFVYDHITSTTSKSQLVIKRLSLRREFPLQFIDFLRSGRMVLYTTLDQFHDDMPGTYNGRIKRVGVDFVGISSVSGVHGSLSCAGVSAARSVAGPAQQKVHRAETMIIPPLMPEKSFSRLDAASLAAAPGGELAVFENVGLQCSWKLDVPLRSNDVRMAEFADVGLIVAYLCQHDAALEDQDLASQPAHGEAEFTLGLRQQGRDEQGREALGRLEEAGEARFLLAPSWLPRYVRSPQIRELSVICIDRDGRFIPLALRLVADPHDDASQLHTADADGVTRVETQTAPGGFHSAPVPAAYTLRIDAADNPALRPTQVGRALDLSAVHDILLLFAYEHSYRT